MKPVFLRFFVFILFFICILGLKAQDFVVKPDYQKKFSRFLEKDGLSDNRILDIIQDRYGFIWIATENGLNRYDGYEFLIFRYSELDSTSISSNIVTSIEEDIYGNLWIGTEFGLNRYDRKQNVFIHYFEESGLQNNHIRALLADEKGTLWIETVDGHLHEMNIRSKRMWHYKHGGTSQAYYHYHSIFKQNDTSLWVGGRNQDVQRFNPLTKEFTYFRYSNSYDYGKRVNDVSHYFRDSQNQLWVCGLDGAYKFKPETGDFELFLKGSVFHMFEDDQNNLWFGTGNGIYIYNRIKNDLGHINSDVNNPNSLSNRNINRIIQDRSGVIWVATNDGLNIYSPKLHQFLHYYHIPENEFSISGRTVTTLLEEKPNLWIGTKEEGLNQLNLENGKLKKFSKLTSPSLISNSISDLLIDEKNNLWIAHWSGQGIEFLKPDRLQTNSFRIDKCSTNYDWYHQIVPGKNNQLLLAVWGGHGLYTADLENKSLENLGKSLTVIPNEPSVRTLNCENDSIWWLGGENGVIRYYLPQQYAFYKARNLYSDKKPGFQELKLMKEYNYVNANIPDFNTIDQIAFNEDITYFDCDDQTLFYSHKTHEFGILERNSSEIEFFDIKGGFESDSIIDYVETDTASYFITASKLYQTDSLLMEVKELNLKTIPVIKMSDVEFQSLSTTRGSLIIGTNMGLITYNLNSSGSRFLRTKFRDFMGYQVHLLTAICEGNKRDYWLGTTSTGLARWFPGEGTIINYISDEFDSTAFWGWDVSFIFKDSQNRIWSGGEGLHLFDDKSETFLHFTTKNGLPSNNILGMTEDASGRLWLTTDNGLSCLYFDEETFINYNEAVGLPDKKMTGAIISLSDHRIAAGLSNGFVVFQPDSLLGNHYIPPVMLTKFQVIGGKTYKDLAEIDSIVLQADENHIAFSFSSLDYNSPRNNRYQYKLSGIDEEWIEVDAKSRWINYSNLDPGSYLLQLRGSNNNGIWNNNGKSLYIYIKPHFYEQWWFYLLIGLLVVFGIVMVGIYRVREINFESRSAQMEQRLLRSQMNPHFIFNSLSAIQNYIFKNEPLEAATYLSDFSNLVRMILNNSRKDFIPIEEEVATLKRYLQLQKLRFNDMFEYELIVDEQLISLDIEIPPMLAQPFIENSIEHAFKGMNERGLIKICFNLEGNNIKLVCRDNGIGINAALKQKREQLKKHQSLATKITHDRIRVLSKVYKAKIHLNIQDLNDIGSSQGTQVIIKIPIQLKRR